MQVGTIDGPTDRRVLLGGIVVLGVAIRAYGLGAESLWFDETFTATVILDRGLESILLDLPAEDPHPPLYYLLLELWTSVVGVSAVGLRSLSVFADALSMVLVYAVAARLYDRRVGLVATLLFALSPFYVWYAQEARMYALVTLFAVASFYMLLVIVRGDDRWWRGDWGYVGATIALCYTHAFGPLILLAQNVFLADGLLKRGYVGRLRPMRWLKLQAIVGVAILPYYVELLTQTFGPGGLRSYITWIPELTVTTPWKILGSYVGRAIPPASVESRYSLWTFESPLGDLSIVGELVTLAALVLLLWVVGRAVLRRRREPDETETEFVVPTYVLLAWLVVPVLALAFLSLTVESVFFDRYTAIAGVALLVLLARGLTELGGTDRRTVATVGVAVLVLSVPVAGIHADTQKQEWREAVGVVEDESGLLDAVLVSPYWSVTSYEYYATQERAVTGVRDMPRPATLDEAIGDADRVWLVASFSTETDYSTLVSQLRDRGFSIVEERTFRDVDLYEFER